jgi:hypothetical protein
MDGVNMIEFSGYILSALTGFAGWFAGRRKTRNDFISELQNSINLLAEENNKLLAEMLAVKKQNVQLLLKVESIEHENGKLKAELEELGVRFKNIKTITRSK